MNPLQTFVHVIEYFILIYFGFAAIYIFIFGLAGRFTREQKTSKNLTHRKVAVLIPGYKEDAVILDVARENLNQDYPPDRYEVVIIADSFQYQTIKKIKQLPVTLIEVSFQISTKSKALNRAMEVLAGNYDIALVLDADNIMKKDFISKINQAFAEGFTVVQGHRIAKNMNTSFAILDALSEEVNNHIYRKGHRNLGFSSALIGSGMAFDYSFFKNTMSQVKAVGGFDKELELKLLKDRKKIEYLHNAIILDEKVQNSKVFANQRRRWLSAQFVYFGKYFFPGLYHLFFKGNIDFFDKVYQMISPPRILLTGLTTIIALFYAWFDYAFPESVFLKFGFKTWGTVLFIVILSFLFSIPGKFYSYKTFRAVLSLPKAFGLMIISLFRLKGANKKFIHTSHGKIN